MRLTTATILWSQQAIMSQIRQITAICLDHHVLHALDVFTAKLNEALREAARQNEADFARDG